MNSPYVENFNMMHDPMWSFIGNYRYEVEDRQYLLSPESDEYSPSGIRTLHALLDATLQYYREENLMEVTLPKICAVSGFSKNVIYKYYKSVSDIMTATLNREIIALEMAAENSVTIEYRNTMIKQFEKTYGSLMYLVGSGQKDALIKVKRPMFSKAR